MSEENEHLLDLGTYNIQFNFVANFFFFGHSLKTLFPLFSLFSFFFSCYFVVFGAFPLSATRNFYTLKLHKILNLYFFRVFRVIILH